jgi:phosphopantetheine adenylyltransferase
MSLTSLKDLLSDSIKRAKISDQVDAIRIFEYFKKEIGEKIGERALNRLKLVSFKNGVLKISILSSALASEIKLHEQEIINNINQQFKKKVIKKLLFY